MDNKMTNYVLKKSKSREKELKYDFMPSLLEIIERPAHIAGTVIIVGVFSLLVVAVIWACLSKTDIVITSQGTIQPVGNVNVVEAAASGIVKSINVQEGQYVKEGDVLLELNSDNLDIDEYQLNQQYNSIKAEKEVYELIKSGKMYSDIDINDYEVEYRSGIQAILDNDLSYHHNLDEYMIQKKDAEYNCQLAEIQLDELYESGTQRQYDSQLIVIKQRKNDIEKAEMSLNDLKAKYSAQINSKLAEIESKLQETDTGFKKYKFSKDHYSLIAPVSGYIQSLSVNTIGETVSPDEKLVMIIPENSPVEMSCYVKNMDIADVKVGMKAAVKLEAYPYNKFGTVDAEVTYISPGSFSVENVGSVYLVKLDMHNTNEDIKIFTGLSGTVEIKTGKRTVMEYFLDPITKGFGDSMKEK